MGDLQPQYCPLLEERDLGSRLGPHGHLPCVMPGTLGGKDEPPVCADGETIDCLKLCTSSVQLQRQARLCGAGVPSSGHRAPHSAPRLELPKVRLAAVDWQGSPFLEPSAVQRAAAPPHPG